MLRLDRFLQAGSGLCLACGIAVCFPSTVVSQARTVRSMPQQPAPAGPYGQGMGSSPVGYGMTAPVAGSSALTSPSSYAGFRGSGGATTGGVAGFGNSTGGAKGNFTGYGGFTGKSPAVNGFNQSPTGATVVSQPNVAMPLLFSAPINYSGLNAGGGFNGFNGFGGINGMSAGFNGFGGINGGFNGMGGASGFGGANGMGAGFNGFGGANGIGVGMSGVSNFNGFSGGLYGKPGGGGFGGFNGGHGL